MMPGLDGLDAVLLISIVTALIALWRHESRTR